jgi:hypothetical protein
MLMYGSECWAVNKADRKAVEAADMLLGVPTKQSTQWQHWTKIKNF